MGEPELTAAYRLKKGIELSKDPYFFKAARMCLASCLHSEDSDRLTPAQIREAGDTLDKIKKNLISSDGMGKSCEISNYDLGISMYNRVISKKDGFPLYEEAKFFLEFSLGHENLSEASKEMAKSVIEDIDKKMAKIQL